MWTSKNSIPVIHVILLEKHRNMRLKSTFISDRNNDLLRAYRQVVSTRTIKTQREALHLTINSQSLRFWVTPECATKAIYRLKRGDELLEMKQHRREMFLEIFHRYNNSQKKKEFQGKSINYICTFIVEETAPKFYMEVSTAMKLFKYQIKQNRKCTRKHNSI